MMTTTRTNDQRGSFRVQFSAWGDDLDVDAILKALDGELEHVAERKGQRIALASGKERTAKTGRVAIWEEVTGGTDVTQEVLKTMVERLARLPQDISTRFAVEKSRLDCQVYYEASTEEDWSVSFDLGSLAILAERGIELSLDIMP